MTLTFLVLTALVAIGDWAAVGYRYFRLEYLLKPLTLVLLVVAAAGAALGPGHWWVVAALACCLLGDIALLGERDSAPDRRFLAGAAAFGLGHASYLVAFSRHGLHPPYAVAGILVVAGAAGLVLGPVLSGARARAGRPLAAALGGYAALLGAMTVLAVATGSVATALGGVLFLVSDAVLAHDRFVRRLRHGPLAVIVTYHVAQLLIVIGLVTHW